jgi:DinB family protein
MHPRLSELLRYIDDQAELLRTTFQSVPRDRVDKRPGDGRWSPAEVMHHVVIVERRVTPLFARLIGEARAIGPESDESPVLAAIRPERFASRERRVVTSEAFTPRDTNSATLVSEFDETRHALRDTIVTGDGLALGRVSAPHPALGTLTLYEWIAFVGAHAARHAEQMREAAS